MQRFGGGAGLAAIGLYVGENPMNVINALISAGIAFTVTFIIMWFIGFEDVKVEESSKTADKKKDIIFSPMNGEVIPISKVSDEAFAKEEMGKSYAIYPYEGKVYAPVKGKIVSMFHTKHAIGIESENGAEILIHVGIDTVNLNGEFFETYFHEGDEIMLLN